MGAIATVAERDLEQMVDDKVEGKIVCEGMWSVLMDTFSFNPTPQIIKPLIDLYANKNSFTGRDIEKMGMSKVNRKRAGTTNLAKGTSWVLDNSLGRISKDLVESPVQADYLIQQYLGWVGSMGAATVDVISKAARRHESPFKSWDEFQPIRCFYSDSSNPSYMGASSTRCCAR